MWVVHERVDELTDVIDTAYLDSASIMTRDYYENTFKNSVLVIDVTTNNTPIATYGSLEGFVPVKEEN